MACQWSGRNTQAITRKPCASRRDRIDPPRIPNSDSPRRQCPCRSRQVTKKKRPERTSRRRRDIATNYNRCFSGKGSKCRPWSPSCASCCTPSSVCLNIISPMMVARSSTCRLSLLRRRHELKKPLEIQERIYPAWVAPVAKRLSAISHSNLVEKSGRPRQTQSLPQLLAARPEVYGQEAALLLRKTYTTRALLERQCGVARPAHQPQAKQSQESIVLERTALFHHPTKTTTSQ